MAGVGLDSEISRVWSYTGVMMILGGTVWVWADRLCNYLATGQSAGRIWVLTRTWSVSKCSRDLAGQSEFYVRVSRLQTFSWPYCYRQLTVSYNSCLSHSHVQTAWQSHMPSHLQIVHWPNYKLNRLQTQTVTLVPWRWFHDDVGVHYIIDILAEH